MTTLLMIGTTFADSCERSHRKEQNYTCTQDWTLTSRCTHCTRSLIVSPVWKTICESPSLEYVFVPIDYAVKLGDGTVFLLNNGFARTVRTNPSKMKNICYSALLHYPFGLSMLLGLICSLYLLSRLRQILFAWKNVSNFWNPLTNQPQLTEPILKFKIKIWTLHVSFELVFLEPWKL